MKVKPPPSRRTFASPWDEILYLYDKLLYWYYQRDEIGKARIFAQRLQSLLSKVDPSHESIRGEECWSLIHEVYGDLPAAIRHRKNEIRLIRRLQQISRDTPSGSFALTDFGYDDLSDRLDLLAMLCHADGQPKLAIQTLLESKRLCAQHGIPFDGEDLLQEYTQDVKPERSAGPDPDVVNGMRRKRTSRTRQGV
jgi:hypothetical protein